MPPVSRRHAVIGTVLASAMVLAGVWLFATQKSATVQLGRQTFAVQVADTPEKRRQGLSGTEPLGKNQGMLFIFDADDYHGIWMKDMNYAIDIVWLDAEKVVVTVAQNISPDTYPQSFTPDAPARYVVELPAGAAQRHGIAKGDIAKF